MENMSKALLIGASVLIGLMIFALFIYELTYASDTAKKVKENKDQEKINIFNVSISGYADRDEKQGYLGIKNAISAQEFATLINLTRDWNDNNPSEIIDVEIKGDSTIYLNLNKSLEDRKTLESIFNELNKKHPLENYYFEFSSQNIEYSKYDGRINKIKLLAQKK